MPVILVTDLDASHQATLNGERRSSQVLVDEDEFREANAHDEEVLGALALLDHPGAEVTFGGGAAPWIEIRRPCKACAAVIHAAGRCVTCAAVCTECDRCGCPSAAWCQDCAPRDGGVIDRRTADATIAERAVA